jgi:hypothetical protein
MSKTALLTMNAKTAKWEATFGGKVIVSSPDKKYVRHVIEKGLNMKARNLGITKVEELGVASEHMVAHSAPLVEFDINERFQFLADYVDMVAHRDMKSAIVVGEGGLGKSFTVMNQLAKNGLKELSVHSEDFEIGSSIDGGAGGKNFVVVKGYSTAKGLFRTLFENRNRLVVFDDCDSILRDEVASNLLKAALDSYDKRIVTWNAESFGDDGLPKSFEFTGAVIFISNMPMHKIPQAIISRSAPADVSMTRPEIIARMRQIVKEGEFMSDVEMSVKLEALDFIASHINNPQIKAINLRTLIAVTTNRRCKPENWQRLSLSMMMAAR